MDSNKLLVRKTIRLREYDYSMPGYYFITICTDNKKRLLCDIIEDNPNMLPKIELTEAGREVEKSLINSSNIFKAIYIEQYVIMPNHIHFIVVVDKADVSRDLTGGRGNPPLQDMVGRIKSFTTYQYNKIKRTKGQILWQRSFHDHIVRNESELDLIREYIENNPLKWRLDKYYME